MLTLKALEEGSRSSEITVVHHLFVVVLTMMLVVDCCGYVYMYHVMSGVCHVFCSVLF